MEEPEHGAKPCSGSLALVLHGRVTYASQNDGVAELSHSICPCFSEGASYASPFLTQDSQRLRSWIYRAWLLLLINSVMVSLLLPLPDGKGSTALDYAVCRFANKTVNFLLILAFFLPRQKPAFTNDFASTHLHPDIARVTCNARPKGRDVAAVPPQTGVGHVRIVEHAVRQNVTG